MAEFRACVDQLREVFERYHNGSETYVEEESDENVERDCNLSLPPWICQPYIRMEPDEHIKLLAVKQKLAEDPERVRQEYFDDDGRKISRKLMKRLLRSSRRPNAKGLRSKEERSIPLCSRTKDCVNPMVKLLISVSMATIYLTKVHFAGNKMFVRIVSSVLSRQMLYRKCRMHRS